MKRVLALPAWALALVAVVLFAGFEAVLHWALKYMSADLYLAVRLPISCLFILILSHRIFGEDHRAAPPTFNPLMIPWIQWQRGTYWLLSIVALAVTLALSPTQTFAYLWFLLHPFWTLLFSPLVTNAKSSFRPQILPLIVTFAGVVLFIIETETREPPKTACPASTSLNTVWRDIVGFVAPLSAGIFFALANMLSSTVKSQTGSNSATTSFYSAYIGLLLLPAVPLAFAAARMRVFCVAPETGMASMAVGGLAIACLVVAAASILFTEAFARPGDQAVPATMDVAIVIPAAMIGLFAGTVTFTGANPLISAKGAGLLVIMVGAAWSAWRYEKASHAAAVQVMDGTTDRTD